MIQKWEQQEEFHISMRFNVYVLKGFEPSTFEPRIGSLFVTSVCNEFYWLESFRLKPQHNLKYCFQNNLIQSHLIKCEIEYINNSKIFSPEITKSRRFLIVSSGSCISSYLDFIRDSALSATERKHKEILISMRNDRRFVLF